MEILNCIQGSDEWFEAKIASIGGTAINKVMAKGQGKTRKALLYDMVGELMSGELKATYSNDNMKNGLLYEPEARNLYSFINDVDVEEIGMFKDGPHKHYSPDGLIHTNGLLEVKVVIPSVFAERKDTGVIPTEYIRQMLWGLKRSDRDWCDFMNYCPWIRNPDILPYNIQRVERNVSKIVEMEQEADRFIDEMLKLYNKMRRE